ncbi:sodium/hydrogen exchanger 3.2 precursor [Danio rerio]|uniref:Sodium/hydrogen exchanger n=1 Tax=Danio rerio TaxID=7955 RepID=A9XP97_DANRE|nr:sodium/hydrogen exchanger 3.2 precursor [Danio rerio]ABU68830.1 sodium hydrogen exchanger 3b [Danio rerio]|eukprot:NP_001106951.1 solute carrier family 9 member A3, tandem duplicate 2 precursor [Danio rerio]
MAFSTLLLAFLVVSGALHEAAAGLDFYGAEGKQNYSSRSSAEGSASSGNSSHSATITTLPIVTWKWHHVETPYLVALWILTCWICKLVTELNHNITSVIPESGLLIILGFILGGIVWGADKAQTFKLIPVNFFFYLLPQIILDASYCMPNKLFFGNLGAILVHAIIGTCWNAGTVGIALWACYEGGAMGTLNIGCLQFLLFGALMSAVDPVAVIAVFEEVHVNEVLYILVFGESLLNDGVTVVLYNVFDAFVSLGGPKINAAEIIKGIVSFAVVAFGGSFLGVVFAVLTSMLTRVTKNVQIIEAGFIIVLGYLSYLTAEMLSLSAILSLTFCGVCCQKYINANMDEKSVTCLRYSLKVLANGSETMIFVFLGVSAIDQTIWVWNTGFILLTLLFIVVFRMMGVFFLNWILNQSRLIPIDLTDQLVMGYGGLRGAVAYGLAASLDENKIPEKNLMLGTTLIVVYFTVILQGITMKPLVNWLKVKKATQSDLTLNGKLNNRVFEHTLTGMEDICGRMGDNWWTRHWNHFEEKYVCWLLMTSEARKRNDKILDAFHKLNVEDATKYVNEGESKGSLAFIRSYDSASVDFKKKLALEYADIIPDIMADMSEYDFDIDSVPVTSVMKNPIPSVSLDIHEQERRGMSNDLNAHHLLEQHLYKSRRNNRATYSRSHYNTSENPDEMQEIFQRTMGNRLESFKSAKMGVNPAKKVSKHPKKDAPHKPNGKPADPNRDHLYGDEDFEFSADSASSSENTCQFPRRVINTTGAGVDNPAYIPELDTSPSMRNPPWQTETGHNTAVAPSQRAQGRLPWTPTNLRRLAPLRVSSRSTDSFAMPEPAADEETPEEKPATHHTRL